MKVTISPHRSYATSLESLKCNNRRVSSAGTEHKRMSDDEAPQEAAKDTYYDDLKAAAELIHECSGKDHDLLPSEYVSKNEIEVLFGKRLLEVAEGIRKRRMDIMVGKTTTDATKKRKQK